MSSLEILYEDNHLIAVNKVAGLLTQPTEKENDSLEVQLKVWMKEKYHKPGNVFLGVVHRLDRPVSGIVLFAKTSKALSRLNASLRAHQLQKTYCALVEGQPSESSGTLEHYLKHDEYQAYVCDPQEEGAKLARLHYITLKQLGNTSLLQIILETGRYHQIRTQCAAMGCPIVGDQKYGSRQLLPGGMIALHHWRLQLEHPITKAVLQLEAPLPQIMREKKSQDSHDQA